MLIFKNLVINHLLIIVLLLKTLKTANSYLDEYKNQTKDTQIALNKLMNSDF